ncbi:MAG: LLM class flavin-dependent oxidoreductase [SAR202 cluster bacterium]|mgnify:CR=1 FL=1|nr:LLM class flavin-dependent oxidoreductase [SAR202 cluster bacterium]MDP6665619.1 LLM class flavin-dependent oxidoreductase [SAR202 cluster bacterium]MQG68709.1 LLM class flavin-dependent oxidoreductase [SAR202 cluster bacterium]
MKFGILLPTRGLLMEGGQPKNIESILSMAETAEAAGLDSVWVGDSLTAKPRLEPLTVLAALATRTRRVRIGTAVMLGALRHPVLLAHAAATVDLISEGRVVLGLGIGGAFNDAQRQEWLNAGVDPSGRASRFEETVDLLKRLTRGDEVTFQGRHFDLREVSIAPVSPNAGGVRTLIACHWRAGRERQFRRAAELGNGYMSISDYPNEYAQVTERVRARAEERGRDFESMERSFYMTVNMLDDAEAATDEADRFLKLYYGMNIWGDRWGPWGPAELTIDRIRRYQEAGAETMIVRFASFDQERQLQRFLDEVVPEL